MGTPEKNEQYSTEVSAGSVLSFTTHDENGDRTVYGVVTGIVQNPIESRDGTWSSWPQPPEFAVDVALQLNDSGVHSQHKFPGRQSEGGRILIIPTPPQEAKESLYHAKAQVISMTIAVVSPESLPPRIAFSYGASLKTS